MYTSSMRTTIEMKREHRAKLLALAARRGEKGFSSLVAEALEDYLRDRVKQDRLLKKALSLRGTLSGEEGERLRDRVATIREFWR